MVLPMLLSVALGALIGLEREIHGHPAGLRTHILVSLGSTVAALVSTEISRKTGDPGRVAAQVVTGIGFLGAGAIIREGASVRGLTTAASIWTTAMIGLAAGVSSRTMPLAVVASGIVVIVLWWLHHIEGAMGDRSAKAHVIEIETDDTPAVVPDIVGCLAGYGGTIRTFELRRNRADDRRNLRVSLKLESKDRLGELMSAMGEIAGVRSVSLP